MTSDTLDGDLLFGAGMDTYSEAVTMAPGKYVLGTNVLNRGGVLQTRPGFRTMFKLPDGVLQGFTTFTPSQGLPQLLALVSGVLYASTYPFKTYRTVQGANMSTTAKKVYSTQTTKALSRNPDGSLKLVRPYSLRIFQDGINPPASYDGSKLTVSKGKYAIPQGTVMEWAGGRLWVARRERLFASDLADPLSFAEQTFNTLGGVNFFILPGPITGLTRAPGNNLQMLMAFTSGTTSTFRSDILDRTIWPSVQDFQRINFPKIGCVSQRSICSQAGILWWYSLEGLTRLDAAQSSAISTRLDYMDNEMSRSKSRLAADLSGIASASYENILLTSVPHADKFNKHTWVLDGAPKDLLVENAPPSWASIWTGVRPVEWASLERNGVNRLFCASVDQDGKNRVYEAFTPDRQDNGCDIPWSIETRSLAGDGIKAKEIRYLEYGLSELAGETNIKISWAGASRGQWKSCATPTLQAREGNIDSSVVYNQDSVFYALKKQSRLARTQDIRNMDQPGLSSAGVEGPVFTTEVDKEAIDTAFAFRIEGSGRCGLRHFKVFMDAVSGVETGQPNTEEGDDNFVRFDGAAADNPEDLDVAPETYTSTKTATARYKKYTAKAEATIVSRISQAEADKRAQQVAQARAEYALSLKTPVHVGSTLVV